MEWIARLSNSSLLQNAVDKSLTSISCDDEVFECFRIANACVASASEQRPTMLHVYQSSRAFGNGYRFSADDELKWNPTTLTTMPVTRLSKLGHMKCVKLIMNWLI